ncbi:MAG: zinc ABC transporter substrate-binding protein [Emcibacter sp.]|nr:zinc ABC transporter substrate-binding protein [Emcibacter sp.]
MFKRPRNLLLSILVAGFFSAVNPAMHIKLVAKELKVIATIKPLHSLVASVMGHKGKLDLMVSGGLDPHIFRLKPSIIRQIHNSDVIFYIDPDMEVFLKSILKRKYANFLAIPMARQKGIHLIAYRTSKIWHRDNGEPKDHKAPAAQDLHIWLDPSNARRMVKVIEATLSKLDPVNSLTYIQNAAKTITRLYAMEEDIREKLRPLREKSMIVYHDAFQYFEKSFGLKAVGAIALKSDQNPSAKHIKMLKRLAKEKKVTCVLGMPGAHPRIATVVMSGTGAGFDVVDPLGLYIKKGPDLYFELMTTMAQNIIDCQDHSGLLEDLNDLR